MRAGEIQLPYHSARIKGEIADGCKVIELGVFIPRQLKLLLGPAQLFVLHLQLHPEDLVFLLGPAQLFILHLQLALVALKIIDEPLRRFLGPGWLQFFRRFRTQPSSVWWRISAADKRPLSLSIAIVAPFASGLQAAPATF